MNYSQRRFGLKQNNSNSINMDASKCCADTSFDAPVSGEIDVSNCAPCTLQRGASFVWWKGFGELNLTDVRSGNLKPSWFDLESYGCQIGKFSGIVIWIRNVR